jgi:shikimate dehydrogenase
MTGQSPLTIELARLPAGAVVSDLVYAPLETALLTAAKARGLRAVDGLGMLLHQAVGGFQRWFGVRPQVTKALRALVEADLIH